MKKLIDKDQAEKIRKAQIGNALKKLNEGKSLTLAEKRLIEDETEGHQEDAKVMGIAALSAALNVGKQAIRNALKNVAPSGTVNGGNPAWTKSQALAALQASNSKAGGGSLQSRKLEEQIRKLKLENDQKDGRLINRSDVVETIARIGSRWASIRTHEESQAPIQLIGKTIPEIREYVRDLFDRIGSVFKQAGEEWK